MDGAVYTGQVCYQDGWHHTVVTDQDDRVRCVAIAAAHLTHARKRGTPEQIADAENSVALAKSHSYDTPGERLFLDDTDPGNPFYRLAVDGDQSWHDRKHRQFSLIEMESGAPAVQVNADEMAAIKKMLDDRRGQS